MTKELSPIERQILELKRKGKRDQEIADALHLTVNLVRVFEDRIQEKLDANDRESRQNVADHPRHVSQKKPYRHPSPTHSDYEPYMDSFERIMGYAPENLTRRTITRDGKTYVFVENVDKGSPEERRYRQLARRFDVVFDRATTPGLRLENYRAVFALQGQEDAVFEAYRKN